MRPIRKSESGRYTNEMSQSKEWNGAKRSKNKKRKLSDMLGPQWTMEELSQFYDAYRKYGCDWTKVADAVRSRSRDMVEALYSMNRAYLNLPHGTASAAGLIAMMTDHYCNLAGNDSDQESNDGVGSSRKSQKRAHVKVQPTTSKVSNDQFVLHVPTIDPNDGCLSLLKKKCSRGNRPCPVGKRTPRFPISLTNENSNGENYVFPTRQDLKLKANANDDEVAHEIAIALIAASRRCGSSHVSGTPGERAKSAMSSLFGNAQRKHSLAEMASTQILAPDMDEDFEGNRGADTDDLFRFKHLKMETISVGTVKKKIKLEGNKYEVDDTDAYYLHDTKEECNVTEEGQRSGATGDEAPEFDALQTLADLSLMMRTEDEDDSKLQFKGEDDNHFDELVPSEALPMNQKKGKCRYSVVRKKGYQPISSPEVASCKTSKPGKASDFVVGTVPAENQDLQLSITKTPSKKQKMQLHKLQRPDADLNIHVAGSRVVEDGEPGNKFMNKIKISSQSGSPNITRNSGKFSSSADLQKQTSNPAQSAEQILVVNQVNLLTEVRSRHKMNLKKPRVPKHLKFPDKISNDQSDLPLASLHDRAINSKVQENLSICLSNPRLRRWCNYEWFYSAIDYPWFAKKEFVEYLHHVGLGHVPRLTRVEWGVIRSSLGKPRRFSEQFLKEEKEKLNQYRDSVRKHYTELLEGVQEGLATDLARPLSVGERVIAIHPKTREIHNGTVLTVDHSRCRVQFDRHELGVEFVMDIDCMPLSPSEDMPALLGKQTVPVDKLFENLNELKLNVRLQECVKLCSGNNTNNTDDISQLSPSANPAILLKQTKMGLGSPENASYHPCAPAPIQAKQADAQALAELTCALAKKEAILVKLRCLNDEASGNQKDGDRNLKDSEPFKKHYAAVLVQLNEANEQVSSALYCLRQRNTYEGNIRFAWSGAGTNLADPGGGFSFGQSARQTCESGPHVNEIIDSSKTKAQAMVDAAMQAISSLKVKDSPIEKIEEAVDFVSDQLPYDGSSEPAAPDPNTMSASGTEVQIPSELISKCVATLLMIQKCTQEQFPPSDVAQILDFAVTSLQPRSCQNVAVYAEIQQCIGMIKNQIVALIPA